jgi:hypothetical protein
MSGAVGTAPHLRESDDQNFERIAVRICRARILLPTKKLLTDPDRRV